MKKMFIITFGLMFILCGLSSIAVAANYKGKVPPSLETIQKHVSIFCDVIMKNPSQKEKVLGLHKLREGAYLVITDFVKKTLHYGPYTLFKLESDEWVLGSADPSREYIFITK